MGDVKLLILIAALVHQALIYPLVVCLLVSLLADIYALVAYFGFKRKYPPNWWSILAERLIAFEERYVIMVALPYVVTAPPAIAWDILHRDYLGLLIDVVLTAYFWRKWKNRPRKKKKPNKVLSVIRERAGRLVVVPQPA